MEGSAPRKRGGSFHMDRESEEPTAVEFMTPMYEGDTPEPLDLSKLCLDDDLFDREDGPDESPGRDESNNEENYSRGRSRSRSVHENDLNVAPQLLVTNPDSIPLASVEPVIQDSAGDVETVNHIDSCRQNDRIERTGPLAHREVLALKKGLEEANQPVNRQQAREDEEERMAADAEKRKRLLLSSNPGSSSGVMSRNGPVATRREKILMLGDSGVGKSSLIMRWTMDSFSPSLVSTVGVNFKSKKVTIRGELVQVQVWDTAGQEQFHKITTSYYKGAQGIMLVYDVSDQKSLDNVQYWIKNIKAHASDSVQIALIGNKTDLRSSCGGTDTETNLSCIATERGQDIATKFGIPFFETSAKDSDNVDNAFTTLVQQIVELQTPAKGNVSPRGGQVQGLDRRSVDRPSQNSEKSRMFSSLIKGSNSPPNNTKSVDGNGLNDAQHCDAKEKCTIM